MSFFRQYAFLVPTAEKLVDKYVSVNCGAGPEHGGDFEDRPHDDCLVDALKLVKANEPAEVQDKVIQELVTLQNHLKGKCGERAGEVVNKFLDVFSYMTIPLKDSFMAARYSDVSPGASDGMLTITPRAAAQMNSEKTKLSVREEYPVQMGGQWVMARIILRNNNKLPPAGPRTLPPPLSSAPYDLGGC